MGRPSSYNDRAAFIICARIARGEGLRGICRDKHMPSAGTVHRWLNENTAFQEQYAQARKDQADTIFDEILDIADETRNDHKTIDGREVVDNEAIQRSRLRIDARKWMAGKLRPKKYGDKLELSGDNNSPLAVTVIERKIVDPKD